MTVSVELTWVEVCGYDELQPERGVRALVGGAHVAVFRTHTGEVLAIGAVDPFSGASVLSRGIVGSRQGADATAGEPFVASPLYKQRFDLRTGTCLDDPSVGVRVYPVDVVAGRVLVGGSP